MRLINAIVVGILLVFSPATFAQYTGDTLLFQLNLSADSSQLRYCKWGGEVCQTLSGPVLMDGERLLFYSRNGYLLYEQSGVVVDSHFVTTDEKDMASGTTTDLILAQPIDPQTILYFRKRDAGKDSGSMEYFIRKIGKDRLKQLKPDECGQYQKIVNAHLSNIAHNTITDEMRARYFAQPQLVGYDGEKKKSNWWTLDKYFSFSSPVIHESDGKFESFFSGVKVTEESSSELRRELVEPLATFVRDERRYYAGVYATIGTTQQRHNQIMYICDNAGNQLYADTLLKQENTDVVLGESVEEKLLYTTRQTARFVFQPAIGRQGNVYYGILDYENSRISVYKRLCLSYQASPTSPDLAHFIDVERDISFEPVSISCFDAQQGGRTIPNVTFVAPDGKRRQARASDLTKEQYIVRVFRQQYRDIDKKLFSRRLQMSTAAHAIRESLLKEETAGCPFAISLSGPHGVMRSFDYSLGERVLCARVIAVDTWQRVLVRVDLEKYAEILIFTADGDFVNRFTFNTQQWQKRKDIVVAEAKSPILELDYESGKNDGAFLKWSAVR